jgi:hypothetical protein
MEGSDPDQLVNVAPALSDEYDVCEHEQGDL